MFWSVPYGGLTHYALFDCMNFSSTLECAHVCVCVCVCVLQAVGNKVGAHSSHRWLGLVRFTTRAMIEAAFTL